VYQDTEKIAQALWDHSLGAVEVDPAGFREMLARAEPGWTPFEEPENYRWFFLKSFPVGKLGVTLKAMMKDSGYPGQEKFQHDRIIDLWKQGAPEWPAFITATGIIADGYHRIAAHRTMKMKKMPVVVSVMRPGTSGYGNWDELWNEAYP
jgi:hypothetical protein